VLTDTTSVSQERVTDTALLRLANRFADIAGGMLQRGLWYPPSRVFAIFEHSARLAHEIQKVFTDITINASQHREATPQDRGTPAPKGVYPRVSASARRASVRSIVSSGTSH
jgi:hypothetical protein